MRGMWTGNESVRLSKQQFRQYGLTFRMESMTDSSAEAASLRIERKAAIRMLSEPLDHKSRHFWFLRKVNENVLSNGRYRYMTNLQICLDRFTATGDIRNELRALGQS
jgi:hypothetical protein